MLALIIPHCWDKTFWTTLPNILGILRFSSLAAGNKHYPWSYVNAGQCSLIILDDPLWPNIVSSHMCQSLAHWTHKKNPLQISRVSFCSSLSSLVLCLANYDCLGLPKPSELSPQHRKTSGLCLYSSPCATVYKLSQSSMLGQSWGSLYFPSLRYYSLLYCLMSNF